jgi:hypothetical protein
MSRRILTRVLVTLLAVLGGVALFSGSDQPVTAHPSPQWQELPAPPFSSRTHPLGVHVGPRVLLLGGRHGRWLRDGASYDLRTGRWRRLHTPIAVSDRDRAVAAAGIAVLRHRRPGRPPSWWQYDPRTDVWSRMRHLPAHLSVPSAFGSEVYVLSGRRVVVYSVQLDRWTPLPPDPLRPVLRGRTVTASRAGTVVSGCADRSSRTFADRWDGLRWHRTHARPVSVPDRRATAVQVGGRLVVFSRDQAWIHTP